MAAPDPSGVESWLLNMENQRQTGDWTGGPPFRIESSPAREKQSAGRNNKIVSRDQCKQVPLCRSPKPEPNPPSLGNASSTAQSRKVERQKERRREKREQGPNWQGRRDPVEGRVYSKDHKAFIAQSHIDWANRADTKGENIPLKELVQRFNEQFKENPMRSRSSLASLIGRDGGLSRLRDSLK